MILLFVIFFKAHGFSNAESYNMVQSLDPSTQQELYNEINDHYSKLN